MRQLNTILLFVCALMATGCVVANGEKKSGKGVAQVIWEAAHSDIMRVTEIFEYVSRMERYFEGIQRGEDLEDLKNQFYGSNISYADNVLTIVTPTSYDTSYTTTVTTNGLTLRNGGKWIITRSGGSSFNLELDAGGEWIEAHFKHLAYRESTGSANLRLKFVDGINSICFDGNISMIDTDASVEKPLHLDTTITSTIDSKPGAIVPIESGEVTITCFDGLYNRTDIIKASYNDSRIVQLTYNDASYTTHY